MRCRGFQTSKLKDIWSLFQITYKNSKGKTKKMRFGLLINRGQLEYVMKRIHELLVESFEK